MTTPSPTRSAIGAVLRGGAALFARHPGRSLGSLALCLGVATVMWNTLLHQSGRHPAPLFGEPNRAARGAPPQAAIQPPAVPPVPVPRPDTTIVGSIPSPAEPTVPRRSAAADPIGGMIRATDPAAKAVNTDGRGDAARVSVVQKALAKLGYGPLKQDGVFGSTTRQAVERFERDRSLPVTGSLGGRTLRQLAQLSGLAVE